MSRPVRYLIPATFLSISFALTSCKTIYSDMYSPRRNHFIPTKEKPKPITPLPDLSLPPTTVLPTPGLPASVPPPEANPAPPPDGAAPMIPGL